MDSLLKILCACWFKCTKNDRVKNIQTWISLNDQSHTHSVAEQVDISITETRNQACEIFLKKFIKPYHRCSSFSLTKRNIELLITKHFIMNTSHNYNCQQAHFAVKSKFRDFLALLTIGSIHKLFHNFWLEFATFLAHNYGMVASKAGAFYSILLAWKEKLARSCFKLHWQVLICKPKL